MADTLHTDLETAVHSKAFEDAYQAASVARRTLYSRAVAYVAHLVRTHLPEAATLTFDTGEVELHEVADAKGKVLWHAPTAAGHGLPDSITDEVKGTLGDVIPFGNLAGAAGWKAAPQGRPLRTIRLPKTPPKTASSYFPTQEGPAKVQAEFTPGVHAMRITGPNPKYALETRDRIRAAIVNSGIQWPLGDMTVTACWTAARGGSAADLALACTALAASGHVPAGSVRGVVMIGQLGLDGRVLPVNDFDGLMQAAIDAGDLKFIVAEAQLAQAAKFPDIAVEGARDLNAALAFLTEMTA
ncbi:magnesium chelatase domain-containing protein [Streptomyces prunicolor]|uniref:magnesium chelatase domain-containing protein n=1 Tax=Streptomyces prunicolor TaxID=67348 RepID=UPI000377F0FB|nr:magnesium chelatase domain-containing protein [Streptomyces prunicolor]